MANPMAVMKKAQKAMVSMKQPQNTKGIGIETAYKPDPYPYGLRISLGNDSLKKLGLSASSFKAGEEVCVKAMCKVKSTRVSDREGEDSSQEVELQITSMAIEEEE